MLKNIQHFVLYKNEHYFSSFPSIALIENTSSHSHQLLLVFRRARDSRWLLNDDDDESLLIKHQVDHIDSRSQLTKMTFDLDLNPVCEAEPLPINPEAADQDACLLVLSNKDILLASFSWYPIHSRFSKVLKKRNVSLYGHPDVTGCFYIFWGGFTRLSHDMGKTWSAHNYLPQLPETNELIPGKNIPHSGTVRGQAIEIGDEILLPVYTRLKNDTIDTSHIYCSKDKGKSWTYLSMIAKDNQQERNFNEPSLLHIEGNTIMAFIRNSSGNDHLVTTISHDRGKTWENWQERQVIGHPTHPLRLSNSLIFICYGYRHEPFGIRAHLMDTSGEHLVGDEIIIRDDGLCGDVGYPWAVEMPDGRILVVYYFTKDDGIRYIAGSLITLV